MAGMVQGKDEELGIIRGISVVAANTGTTEIPLLSLKNGLVYASKPNRVQLELIIIGLSTDLTQQVATFRVYLNTTLTGTPAFAAVDAVNSPAFKDTAATGRTGERLVTSFVLSSTDAKEFDISRLKIKLQPGDILTITGEPEKSNANNNLGASIDWKELF